MYDVIICGAGPVGLLTANLWGKAGKRVLVLEKRPSPHPIPRAIHGDASMMQAFEAIGLKETLMAHICPMEKMRFADLSGKVLLELDMRQKNKAVHDFWFFQPALEKVLLEGIARFPQVEIRWGCELLSFSEEEGRISVTTHEGTTYQATHLLACDGANSTIRKILGVRLIDMKFHQRWAVFDAVDASLNSILPPCHQQYCGVNRAMTFVPGVQGHLRWEVRLRPDEEATEALLHQLLPETQGLAFSRVAEYQFHALLAAQWQKGNVYLLGDAAHQMPPFAGQGLCVGMADALFLSQCLLPNKSAGLYYEKRRKKAAASAIRESIMVGRIINPSHFLLGLMIKAGLALLNRWAWGKRMAKGMMVG